ncbi:Uncharacterised protein [Pseudomonas fragi]|uniref:Uncharacterized protein n=1 Tax=Pseudomonas fragi TaxID=296 RepID=A0A449II65_PSEFR|nr:Uncharacterised protein [Pseudomonas fragi]
MLIILLTISLTPQAPHELLDSVVKERLASFRCTEARILQQPLLLSSGYFKMFSKFPL